MALHAPVHVGRQARRILNDGQHWEFRRGVAMIEWWPSTGTTTVNKSLDLSRMHTLDGLRSALKQFA